MPWVRIDDEFPDHPKVVGAGPLGIAMQVAALCYCNRHLTDGFVPRSTARRLIDLDEFKVDPDEVIDALLRVGMWARVDGGYQIHHYGDYQPSRVEVEAEREKTRDRVAKHRASKRNKGRNATSNAVTNASVMGAPVPKPVPPVSTEGSTVTDTSGLHTVAAQARPIDKGAEDTIWTDYLNARGSVGLSTKVRFTPKRRDKIRTRLKTNTQTDLQAAAWGWTRDPWPDRRLNCDLLQLFRDDEQVEKFANFWRDGPPAVMGKHTSQMATIAQQMAANPPGKEVANGDLGRLDRHRDLAQRQLSRPED